MCYHLCMTSGATIQAARKRLGLNQAALAQRLGVKQQTVSRWERDLAWPPREMTARLAETLEIDEDSLVPAVSQPPTPASTVRRPVRPRSTTLPLEHLPAETFEDFSADVVRLLFPHEEVHRYGGPGHKQLGVDIIAQRPGDQAAATFQCKRHAQFGAARVAAAVAAVEVIADKHHLLLTRVATPAARDEIAKHADWALWDVEDISRIVRSELSRDAGVRLVDTYFPGWREAFLGVPEPSPWRTVDEAFTLSSSDRLYNFEQPLVGRQQVIEQVAAFLKAPQLPLGLLMGRGGLGKTRLLRALAELVEAEQRDVRFLDRTPSPSDFELLPPDDCVVIVDDAHKEARMIDIVSAILRHRPQAQVILALRPHGLTELQVDMQGGGFHPSEMPVWELGDLTMTETENLARAVLGTDFDTAVARRLAQVSTDCPLVTVLGAGLIKRGTLDPSRIDRDPQVRDEILRQFRDTLLPDASGRTSVRSELLNAVAVFQPLHTDRPAVRNALEHLTSMPYDQLVPHLRALEDSGVLLRRGASLRVVPDLLGDVVLTDACFDDRSGSSTGYIERVLNAIGDDLLEPLFVNTSRVDWQVRSINDSAPSLVDDLWGRFEEAFRQGDIRARVHILAVLQKVAFYQPARALALARWAIDNPTKDLEPSDDVFERLYPAKEESVRHELAPLLKHVAYNLEFLPAAAGLLWQLAILDHRPTNQYPSHPLRVLQELAGISIDKPLAYSQCMVDAARGWLNDLGPNDHSPFEVLDSILATEGIDHISEAMTIHMKPFLVRADTVQPVRNQVVELALTEVRCADLRRATRAVESLESSIRFPHGYFGRNVPNDERDVWAPIFSATIEKLAAVAADPSLDPVVSVAIRQAVRWHAVYSHSVTKEAARSLIVGLPNSIAHELALLLFGGWPDVLVETTSLGATLDQPEVPGFADYLEQHRDQYDPDPDYTKMEQRKERRFQQFSDLLLTNFSNDQILDMLSIRLAAQDYALSTKRGNSGPFVWTLTTKSLDLAAGICERVSNDGSSPFLSVVSIALSRLADARDDRAVPMAEHLLESAPSPVAIFHVANAFGWQRGGRSFLLDGEWDLLSLFAGHHEEIVRRSATRAAQVIASTDRSKAIALLSSVPFADSKGVADEVLGSFGAHGTFKWGELSDAAKASMLEQLQACPSIEDYNITEFLKLLSVESPADLITVLTARVEAAEQPEVSFNEFQPLPYQWSVDLSAHPDVPRILDDLAVWMKKNMDSWQRSKYGAEIFSRIAMDYGEPVIAFFDRLAGSGMKVDIDVATHLLREAPPSLLWLDVKFVTRMLHAALAHGDDVAARLGGALHSAVSSGGRSGEIGKPFSEDVEQRDQALVIAKQLPVGSIEERFYRSVADSAVRNIDWHAAQDEKLLDGRNW